MKHKNIGLEILHFQLSKIIIGFLVVAGFTGGFQIGLEKLLSKLVENKVASDLIVGIVASVIALVSYLLLFKFYEKRKITEFSTNNIGRNLMLGLFLGVTLMSLTIFVIYLSGSYHIVAVNSISNLIPALTMAISSAILEEILFRGILFRIIEEKLGSYIALLISALVFGLLHLLNPNSSLIVALGLSIQAGLLLGVLYMYSRNLWLPIGIHFAWNFTLGGVWGASVSGVPLEKSLITSTIQGNKWVTGGQFGPEGSIQATIFCLIVTTLFFFLCYKQNKIQKPFWAK
jgi:uncharacterized protein